MSYPKLVGSIRPRVLRRVETVVLAFIDQSYVNMRPAACTTCTAPWMLFSLGWLEKRNPRATFSTSYILHNVYPLNRHSRFSAPPIRSPG
jgi:hypothetical protein